MPIIYTACHLLPRHSIPRWLLTSVLAALALAGCQSAPTLTRLSAKHHLVQEQIDNGLFRHAIARNRVSLVAGGTLHIYIEGDGLPWLQGRRIARDPTPRQPLALELMVQDRAPALYLGRPCYFGLATSPSCQFQLWTDARYGESVIDSMNRALEMMRVRLGAADVVLIGYSGGGAIAALLAARNPNVKALVTVAGNLDTEAWTTHHGYLPLTNSLNPRAQPTAQGVTAIHLSGGGDRTVPSAVLESYLRQHGGAHWHYPEFDHSCCWIAAWPEILTRIDNHLAR